MKNLNKAFILINSSIGSKDSVYEILTKFDFVKQVYRVNGIYDFALQIEENNFPNLQKAIANNIRKIDGIEDSLTMFVV